MKLRMDTIPDEIITQYNLRDIAVDEWVYCEIKKGIYGLPHAGKIANDRLTQHLLPHGYSPVKYPPGIWTHTTRDITFTLVVNDFGIKYTNIADLHHLQNTLRQQYAITIDKTVSLYCGLTLEWNYIKRYVDVFMPWYVCKSLIRFGHTDPSKPQHSLHPWEEPAYGVKVKYAIMDPNTPLLPPPN